MKRQRDIPRASDSRGTVSETGTTFTYDVRVMRTCPPCLMFSGVRYWREDTCQGRLPLRHSTRRVLCAAWRSTRQTSHRRVVSNHGKSVLFRYFPLHILILLSGFLFGNLFPTFFGASLGKIFTPIFVIVLVDSFNSFYYARKDGIDERDGPTVVSIVSVRGAIPSIVKLANFFKIGFLFGLFVDAFKVGS